MIASSLRLIESEGGARRSTSLSTVEARFCRQKEVVASRGGFAGKSVRQATSERLKGARRDFEFGCVLRGEQICGVVTSFPSQKVVARRIELRPPTPNQSLEPTRMLGTSAAEQPRVPSIRVAHL